MKEFLKKNKWILLLIVYALIVMTPHFFRVFDNYFWGDEAYTIRLAQMNILDMFKETAMDVHPPLYYLIVKFFCIFIGFNGWAFHLVSFLAYLTIVILTLTYLYKKYTPVTCALFISCLSILENTFIYNVEVRMYSYGALFVLLAYLFLERIIKKNKAIDYVFFTLFSLCAAYTHYYCLISVAFFYSFLIVYCVIKRKYIVKVLVSSVVTICLYLPWFFVLLKTFKRTSDDFWMVWIPTVEDCFLFLFKGKLSIVLLICFFAGLVVYAVSYIVALKKKKEDVDKKEFIYNILWIIAGLASIVGTMFVGIMVSRLVRPLFIVRYLYPVSVIAWFLLSLGIGEAKIKGRTVIMIVIVGVMIASSYSDVRAICKEDYDNSKLLEYTLDSVDVKDTDCIITNMGSLDWTISDYYFPGVKHYVVNTFDQNELVNYKRYWYFFSTDYDGADELMSSLSEQGFMIEQVVNRGSIGTSEINVYLVTPESN